MKHLRNLSPRPQLVVDSTHGRGITDGMARGDRIGFAGPLGLGRMVAALPTNKAGGPVKLASARVLHDSQFACLADPDGNLIGDRQALWVHRLLTATVTRDTRRL